MNHYVYITFNNTTKQYYIGGRSTTKNPHIDGYMGSGTMFKKRYKENPGDWDKYILSEHETIEELRAAEYDAIKGHIRNGKCLNMRLSVSLGSFGVEHTDESKKKIGLAQLGKKHTEEAKEKMRKPKSDERKAKISLAHLGKKLTDEHKAKIGLAQLGKKHTEERKAKISLAQLNGQ
jgi:hypothetical protein